MQNFTISVIVFGFLAEFNLLSTNFMSCATKELKILNIMIRTKSNLNPVMPLCYDCDYNDY